MLFLDVVAVQVSTPLSVGVVSEKPVRSSLVCVVGVLCVLTRVDVVLPERCLAVHEKMGELNSLADTRHEQYQIFEVNVNINYLAKSLSMPMSISILGGP